MSKNDIQYENVSEDSIPERAAPERGPEGVADGTEKNTEKLPEAAETPKADAVKTGVSDADKKAATPPAKSSAVSVDNRKVQFTAGTTFYYNNLKYEVKRGDEIMVNNTLFAILQERGIIKELFN